MAAIQSYYFGSVINKIEIFEMKKNKLEKYEGIPTSSRVTPEQTLKTMSSEATYCLGQERPLVL
jgi:hypothetical protein